jgi:hypothetical protein
MSLWRSRPLSFLASLLFICLQYKSYAELGSPRNRKRPPSRPPPRAADSIAAHKLSCEAEWAIATIARNCELLDRGLAKAISVIAEDYPIAKVVEIFQEVRSKSQQGRVLPPPPNSLAWAIHEILDSDSDSDSSRSGDDVKKVQVRIKEQQKSTKPLGSGLDGAGKLTGQLFNMNSPVHNESTDFHFDDTSKASTGASEFKLSKDFRLRCEKSQIRFNDPQVQIKNTSYDPKSSVSMLESATLDESMTDEEKSLVRRRREPMPWRDISLSFEDETGKKKYVSAMQMQYKSFLQRSTSRNNEDASWTHRATSSPELPSRPNSEGRFGRISSISSETLAKMPKVIRITEDAIAYLACQGDLPYWDAIFKLIGSQQEIQSPSWLLAMEYGVLALDGIATTISIEIKQLKVMSEAQVPANVMAGIEARKVRIDSFLNVHATELLRRKSQTHSTNHSSSHVPTPLSGNVKVDLFDITREAQVHIASAYPNQSHQVRDMERLSWNLC